METALPPLPEGALQRCLRMAEHARSQSPRVAHLLRKIGALPTPLALLGPGPGGSGGAVAATGCGLAADPVTCEDVFGPAPVGAAYDHARRRVVLNPRAPPAFLVQSEVTRAVAHELVHAFDSCRAALDARDCAHVACTEVRAANLSGDCDFSVEVLGRVAARALAPGNVIGGLLGGPAAAAAAGGGGGGAAAGFSLAGHQQQCVRRRAQLSLSLHEQCLSRPPGLPGPLPGGPGSPGAAAAPAAGGGSRGPAWRAADDPAVVRTVARVWDACYSDTAPFATN